jgi:hypothetical protein
LEVGFWRALLNGAPFFWREELALAGVKPRFLGAISPRFGMTRLMIALESEIRYGMEGRQARRMLR